MEKNVQQDEVSPNVNEEISERIDLDLEKATIDHEFSSPWEESDLILVVEDQKLHVHRSILKVASPVFKTMLSSDFKEKDANEITLQDKKVNEFVDFLRQIYPSFDSEITLKNIKYIHSLADEYQMTKVMKVCRRFLASVRKTKENAIDMLQLAQDIGADEACQQCHDVLKKMNLTELEKGEFSNLNGKSMNDILLPLVKRYHKCVKDVLPELLGSLDAMMVLWKHTENEFKMDGVPISCQKHKTSQAYRRDNINFQKIYERIKCDECRAMFKHMARNATGYRSPSGTYLTENNISILEEMMDLIKESQ